VYSDVVPPIGSGTPNKILSFSMTPSVRQFKYNMPKGSNGDSATSVIIDSFIPSKEYVDPTPFTQWTIAVKQPELYDLSGVTDVKLHWQGAARF
jgi:hypothetical protein